MTQNKIHIHKSLPPSQSMSTARLLRQLLRPLHPLLADILNLLSQFLFNQTNDLRSPLRKIVVLAGFFAPTPPANDAVIARARNPQHFLFGFEAHRVCQGVYVRAQRAVR
jgi:hypothetical protein